MTALVALALQHRSIAVVGTGKNTGKTVTVNYLVAGASAAGAVLAVTTTGRDGEGRDAISSAPKPEILLPEGSILATSKASLDRGSARLELMEDTGFYNALGEIIIARVRQAGTVELCGPKSASDLRQVIARMQDHADFVIIDGAIDRVASSAPSVTDAVVLATGATIGKDVQEVVALTAHVAEVLQTPTASCLGDTGRKLLSQGEIGVQNQVGLVRPIFLPTVVDAPPEILNYLNSDYSCLLIGGALSDPLAQLMLKASRATSGLRAIVVDGTRILMKPELWRRLVARVPVEVARPINLIAVTINPTAPRRGRLSGEKLASDLRRLLPGLLVLDPLREEG